MSLESIGGTAETNIVRKRVTAADKLSSPIRLDVNMLSIQTFINIKYNNTGCHTDIHIQCPTTANQLRKWTVTLTLHGEIQRCSFTRVSMQKDARN